MIRLKTDSFVLCLLIIIILFVSCNNNDTKNNRVTEITFWHSFVASTHPALKALLKTFEKEYPDIEIREQYVPTGDALIQKLVTAIQSRTAPDISWIHSDFLDKLVQAKAIYPLDFFYNGEDSLYRHQLDDFFQPLLQTAYFKDTLYALPMEATTLALLYNRDLFTKGGLDPDHPPETWDELYDFAIKLTVDRDGDGKTDQYGFYVPVFPASGPLSIWMVLQWSPFVWQAGGRLISEDQSTILFNREPGIRALSLWQNLFNAMNQIKYSQGHDTGFLSGQLAMVLDGPWNLPLYKKIKKFSWSVAPLPRGPVKKATYMAGEHLAVFRQTKHPKQAWTFLKWVTQPEVQAQFSALSGYLPVRRSTLQLGSYKKFLEKDKHMKSFVEQLAIAESREKMDKNRVEINQVIAEAIEKACLGKMDVKMVLDESARRAQKKLNE